VEKYLSEFQPETTGAAGDKSRLALEIAQPRSSHAER
jgi:hypothetical protein